MASRGSVIVQLDLDGLFAEMNETAQVRAGVTRRATEIAARARRIDAAENGGRAEITLTEKTMPNGRFVVQVRSTDGDGEFGTSTTARRRTLRRAIGRR